MEPCPGKLGVIFNSDELPQVADILREHVYETYIVDTASASRVMQDLQTALHPVYGYWGGVFVPEQVAMVVCTRLRETVEKADPDIFVANVGPFALGHVEYAPAVKRTRTFVSQIEQALKRSRRLNN